MPELIEARERDLLLTVTRGDEMAAQFLVSLYRASQIADDVADGDDAPGDMARLMAVIFGEICINPFYLAHSTELRQVILTAAANWLQATRWESQDQHRQSYAFVWRESLETVAVAVAEILGGFEWALKARELLAEALYTGDQTETFEEWRK
ncbi:hypothetical protein [Maricaulis sp.]|jgi:hypothetical protein|uniref:hypothetical protein n=1 Tax=Maricaulis sp. TaxID=1486257 RepID=UPI0026354BA0|nr:hypothetical protein [Maricaulis sp.]MDF1769831.1 hypothetical protein [Maricaulis sp.]